VGEKWLSGWSGERNAQVKFAAVPEEFKGWHHVAVTCDGRQTSAYLDGKLIGTVDEVVATNILSIGSHWRKCISTG